MISELHPKKQKINLKAEKDEDLVVLAALSQDAIIKTSNMTWAKKKKRFSILMNRFCWEHNDLSKQGRKVQKRINSLMNFDTVLRVKTKGIVQSEVDTILSLLTIKHDHAKNEESKVELIFSGGGTISLSIECIDVILKDVSEPFNSAASSFPNHLTNKFKG